LNKFDQFKKEWSDQVIQSINPSSANGRKQVSEETFQEIIKSILKNLEITEIKDSLIDVGCGNGLVLSALSGYFKNLYGCDYCEDMVVIARELNPEAKIIQTEANNLPFNNQITEYSLTYSIFHYLPSYQYAINCIYELIRVTKDKGRILIGDILDIKYKKSILLSDKKHISSKLPLIHRYSEWMFYDLQELVSKISSHKRVKKVQIINQPTMLPFNSYRKDICICL
tara:strand:- start:368 stop:1048 length:681 start_codon:yes stop_codon:yes gene_type:complete